MNSVAIRLGVTLLVAAVVYSIVIGEVADGRVSSHGVGDGQAILLFLLIIFAFVGRRYLHSRDKRNDETRSQHRQRRRALPPPPRPDELDR